MEISARNQYKGRVVGINRGGVVAEVTVDIGNGQEMVSVITNGSVDRLKLAVGSEVTAIVKATEVLLAN
jgi:molybdopterin-binding protein